MATNNSTPLDTSAQSFFATVLQAADQIDAVVIAADNDGIGEDNINALLDVVASLAHSLESAGYESPVNTDDLDISSLCWQLQYFAELVKSGDKKHLPSFRDTFSLMTDALRRIANANMTTSDTALLLAVTRADDGYGYSITGASDMSADDAADALFAITLDIKAKADHGLTRVGRVPKTGSSEDESSAEEAPDKAIDTDDLRRRCDEIHFSICGFCGDNTGMARLDVGHRAYMKDIRDKAAALEDIVSDVDELCMCASRIKTFAGLALDAGSVEHDIPELEAIAVRLLNDFREEAGLTTRTTGDASNLRWQIAKDHPEAA